MNSSELIRPSTTTKNTIKNQAVLKMEKEWNPVGYDMSYYNLSSYNPILSNKKLPIENTELQKVLEKPYQKDDLNLKNTNLTEVREFILSYISKNPKLIQSKDIYNLSIQELVEISGRITTERLRYDYESLKIEPSNDPKNNYKPIPTRVMVPKSDGTTEYWKTTPEGNGMISSRLEQIAQRVQKTQQRPIEKLIGENDLATCRHYSRTFTAIFDTLKSIQKSPKLSNSYSISIGNDTHSWNLITTVEPGKKLNMTMVDPTSADIEKQNPNHTKGGTPLGFNHHMFSAPNLEFSDAQKSLFHELYIAMDFGGSYSHEKQIYTQKLRTVAGLNPIKTTQPKHIIKPKTIQERIFGN